MKQFKGTPGPWRVSHNFSDTVTVLDPRGYRIVTAEDLPILENYSEILNIHHWADDDRASIELSEEEQSANAHLIAAAPELLVALQDLVALVKSRTYPQPDKPLSDWGRAEAAESIIAKALGEA